MGPRVSTDEPHASILIPTRDRRPYLADALRSAQAQTVRAIEIVVSDDGSTDDTVAYVRVVAASDSRVRLVTDNPTAGVFENFEYLVGKATAPSAALLGDDDVLAPTYIERLLDGLGHAGVGVAYAAFDVIDSDGREDPRLTRILRRHHGFQHASPGIQQDGLVAALQGQLWLGACLYRTTLLRELGFDRRFGSAADLDLALRLATRTSFFYVEEALWSYRDHPGSHSRRREQDARAATIAVLSSRSFEHAPAERLRLRLLRRQLLQRAWREVVDQPDAARATMARFREEGGSAGEPRLIVATCVALMPAPARRLLFRILNRGWASVRRASGSLRRVSSGRRT